MTDGLQSRIDRQNQQFWEELCGTSLARALGITDASPESVARFDRAYMALYPYLQRYLPPGELCGKTVLEIGLGYGTIGQILATQAARYVGVDIAGGPVAMMRHRLCRDGDVSGKATFQASALDLPFPDAAFDSVYTIGCLHHTGNLARAVREVHRVLMPGGRAVVMLYNRHSFRALFHAPLRYARDVLIARGRRPGGRGVRQAVYDVNLKGEPAPHTEFVSRGDVRRVFGAFSRIRVDSRNFDGYALFKGRVTVPREWLLNNLGRVLGLDLYIVATK